MHPDFGSKFMDLKWYSLIHGSSRVFCAFLDMTDLSESSTMKGNTNQTIS